MLKTLRAPPSLRTSEAKLLPHRHHARVFELPYDHDPDRLPFGNFHAQSGEALVEGLQKGAGALLDLEDGGELFDLPEEVALVGSQ